MNKYLKKHKFMVLAFTSLFLYFIFYVIRVIYNSNGPFIFGDESEYAMMAYKLMDGNIFFGEHAQYGPLYPLIVGVLKLITNYNIYNIAKFVNLFSLLLTIFAIYLLSRKWDKEYRVLVIIYALTAPIWSFTIALWAEPLFYTFVIIQIITLLFLFQNFTNRYLILLGTLSGFIFLLKPVGAFYTIVLFSLLIYYINIESIKYKKLIFFLIPCCIITLPWIIRNIYITNTIFGYGYVNDNLAKGVEDLTTINLILNYLFGFFYQISYVILMSYGFFGILVYLIIIFRKKISKNIYYVSLYLIVQIIVICVINDLHNTPHKFIGYFVPNGRYLSHFGQIIIILTISILLWLNKYNKLQFNYILPLKLILFIIIIECLILVSFSPLKVLVPAAFMNMPDLGLMFSIEIFPFNRGIPWRGWPHNPSSFMTIFLLVSVLPSLLLSILFNLNKFKSYYLYFFLIIIIFGSLNQYAGISILQKSQNALNEIFSNSDDSCKGNIIFDSNIIDDNLLFMKNFWCGDSLINKNSWNEYIKYYNDNKKLIFLTNEVNIKNIDNYIILNQFNQFKLIKPKI